MLYIMRGADLARFAGAAEPNTDDWPVLEVHGLRDLDLQTDQTNMAELTAFPQQIPPPPEVAAVRDHVTPETLLARAKMFEKAESYRLAFDSYKKLLTDQPGDSTALVGVLRCARSPEEIAFAGTLESRTNEALTDARSGNPAAAEWLLSALKQAWPDRPETHLNYGIFCLERSRFDDAIASFNDAIGTDPRYLPAFEAMAEAYMHKRDLHSAALWSRRILEIDPNHESAKQALAALARQGVTP
jgi:tetratricopeptide (TPR) repeat protein